MEADVVADEGDNAMLSEEFTKQINKNDEIYWKIQEVLKRLLYEYIEYFPFNLDQSDINSDLNKSFIWAYLESLVLLFQLLTLGQPYLLYQDSDNFQWFYVLISAFRPDLMVGFLEFYTLAFILQCCIVLILTIVFFMNLYKAFKPSVKNRWIMYLTLLVDRMLRRYLYIPAIVGFLTSIKFSMLKSSETVHFYSSNISILNNYATCAISYPLLILTLLHISLFSLIDNQEKGCHSRSHSRLILLEIWCILICAISQVFLIEMHTSIQVTIQFMIGMYLSYSYVKYLPYHYSVMNVIKLNTYLTFAWNAFVNLANSGSGSAGSVILITIMTMPIAYIFSLYIIKWRYSYIEKLRFTKLSCPYLSEIQIRSKISELNVLNQAEKEEEADSLRNHIKRMFNFMQNSFSTEALVACWNSRYLFEMEKDEELAKIKLSKVQYLPFSLDGSYLAIRYEKTFHKLSKIYSEQLDYLKFREIYQIVKSDDILICKLQMEFWSELNKKVPSVSKLKNVAKRMKKAIESILKHGDKLIADYPQNTQSLYLFSTFLTDVYNDNERGQDLFHKYSYLKSSAVESFSLFDEGVGIMIISGDEDNTGKIDYLNKEASNILHIQAENAISLNVAQFLPYPINDYKHHNKCMMDFIKNTPKTRVPLPHNSFIVNQKGFLVNIIFDGKCVAYNSLVFFLAALKRNDDFGETALISLEGVIQNHTQNFPKMLDMSESTLIGYSIMSIFPEISQSQVTNLNFVRTTINYRTLWVKMEELQVKSVTFRLVILRSDRPDYLEPATDRMQRVSNQLTNQDIDISRRKIRKHVTVKFEVPLTSKTRTLNVELNQKNTTEIKTENLLASTGGSSSYSISNSSLDTNMKKIVNRSIKLLEISILISVIFTQMCVAFIGMLGIILFISIYKDEAHMDKYSSINQTIVYIQKLALNSKLMTLNAGFDTFSKDIDTFSDLVNDFENNLKFIDRDYSKIEMLYWEKRSEKYYSSDDYLQQILYKLYDSAVSIQNSPILNTQKEGFLLKRNGEGEVLLKFNETAYDIRKQLIENTNEVILNINLVSISSIIMNVLLFLFLIVPSVVTIEKSQRKIWNFYFNISSTIINDLNQKAEARLQSVHSLKSKDCLPKTKLPENYKKIITIDRIWYRPLLHLLLYYGLLAGFAMYYQLVFMSNIRYELNNQPDIIYWDNQRLLGVQSLMYWRLENEQPSEYVLWNSEFREKIIQEILQTSEKNIMNMDLVIDSKEYDLSYKTAGTGELNFGIHSAILSFINSNSQDTSISSQIELMKQIIEKCEELRDTHIESFRSKLSKSIDIGTAVSSVFCVIIIFIYIVYYLPVCRKLQNEILDCWKFTKLIPPEISIDFIRRNNRTISRF